MKTCRRIARLFALAAVLAVVSLARADWTLTTGDFAQQKNLKVNTWDLADGLSVTLESGKLQKIDSRDVLALTANGPKTPGHAAADWKLNLRNGDFLYGVPAGIKGQTLQFTTEEMGIIGVPLKRVLSIESMRPRDPGTAATPGSSPSATPPPPPSPLPAFRDADEKDDAGGKDVVNFVNNDKKEGLIADINGDKVQLAIPESDNAISAIDMKYVSRLSFAGVTTPRTIPPLSARVTFLSGSVLTVPLDAKQKSFAWSINEITLKDPGGKDRKTSAEAIASIDVTGGRVVCLTELDPAKDEQTTFMGTTWPTRINKNVIGEPLKVLKTAYPRGLGVHTRSDIVYDIGGAFDTFQFRVGLDDSAAPQGAADVAVLLDGKVLWEFKGLKTGGDNQISPELSLPVKGGKLLELRATPVLDGGKIDVRGRVDWLNVALTRP